MTDTRQFFFSGSAAALGGQIVRPVDRAFLVRAEGASALTAAGGESVAQLAGKPFGGGFISFRSASTFASGVYDNLKLASVVNERHQSVDVLGTTTTLRAEAADVVVGDPDDSSAVRVHIKQTFGELIGRTQPWTYESSFEIGEKTAVEGVMIGKHRLVVRINHDLFRRYDSRVKLLAAASDPGFVREHGRHLGIGPADNPEEKRRTLLASCGQTYATIVRELQWDGDPYPNATFEGSNGVVIPEFGTIYFGELLVSSEKRRLIMVRMALGSPWGGEFAVADMQDTPIWYP